MYVRTMLDVARTDHGMYGYAYGTYGTFYLLPWCEGEHVALAPRDCTGKQKHTRNTQPLLSTQRTPHSRVTHTHRHLRRNIHSTC